MKQISLALVGFGNVGQAFARLLMQKEEMLARDFGIQFLVTGIRTGRHGSAITSGGINLNRALELVRLGQSLDILSGRPSPLDGKEWIYAVNADALIETTPVNQYTGQPAIMHLQTALGKGMHAITANKGPVVHGYQLLKDLAAARGKRFLFESAVMDGAPIFSLFRGPLPAIELRGFTGILNSCTNLLIGLMEEGRSFPDAVKYAQSIGIAETDPSADIEGWDASIKLAALATVLMDIPLTPQEVDRKGIEDLTQEDIRAAKDAGERWKLVCRAKRDGNQLVLAQVKPERVKPDSPLFSINGTSSYVQFETDVLPGLGIVEGNPGPETTAYGLLADLLNALRGQ